jgi:chromosome segregation ATPase
MCASKRSLAAALLIAAFAATPALAADKKADPAKEQLRRLQQAQRKLEQEKTQLAEQKAAVEVELGQERQKADAEALRSGALKRELAAQRAAGEAAAAKLSARLSETEGELRQTQAAQRAAEAEGKRLQGALAAEQKQRQACDERGQELRQLGGEVLGLYEKKTCLDSSLQSEPFTGLTRVRIENAVEDLRDKLDARPAGS